MFSSKSGSRRALYEFRKNEMGQLLKSYLGNRKRFIKFCVETWDEFLPKFGDWKRPV